MSTRNPADAKNQTLREQGTLNPHPETVRDPLFLENDFFDPRDLIQVKYEMLRRVQIEGQSIQGTVQDFGFSRPSFYKAQDAFGKEGLPGLLPRRRGPQRAHKLTEEIMEFIEQTLREEGPLRATALARRVEEQFGVLVHPRSIERGLTRRKKKRQEAERA
ncbi:MAG: helix-turn-helix domain containing protein [Candidatus Omnitrophica bacterium]|nr:helix-turn-helix domain containing protein [Candidatus Omnitrophota bacterium]